MYTLYYDLWKNMTNPKYYKFCDMNPTTATNLLFENYKTGFEYTKNMIDQQMSFLQRQHKEIMSTTTELFNSKTPEQIFTNQQKFFQNSLENTMYMINYVTQEWQKINSSIFNAAKKSTSSLVVSQEQNKNEKK